MFSTRRVSPFDGMAVTAGIWEEAHEYHRQRQRLHALFSHGPGIVTGLEVIASEPPDSFVTIQPGVAIDPLGRTIVLAEPTAYDVGTADGWLHVSLSYGESRPRSDASTEAEGGPMFVHAEFGIEAKLDALGLNAVELARVWRQDPGFPISDARDPAHPAPNELDLRFRQDVGALLRPVAAVAVCFAGGDPIEHHALGADYLVRAVRRSEGIRAWVDLGVAITRDLARYTLVYLVGQDAFEFNQEEMRDLYEYVQGGGTLLIESCRRDITTGNPAADSAFGNALKTWGFSLQRLQPGHELLVEPYLFSAAPSGFETRASPAVLVGDGVIWSTNDYGCLWGGARRDGMPPREQIRAAQEWGTNIVTYAVSRRQRASDT
jgi:hypothetical protein